MVSIAGKAPGVPAAGMIGGELTVINTCVVRAPSRLLVGQRGGSPNLSAWSWGAGDGAGAGAASTQAIWGQHSFART